MSPAMSLGLSTVGGEAPTRPGLGVEVDDALLGAPFASFGAGEADAGR